MCLRKEGTVLISTMIIVFLMTILGSLLFNMMKNNDQMGMLYDFDKDIYDVNLEEDKKLYQLMKEVNKINKDRNTDDIFSADFEIKNNESILRYTKYDGKMFFVSNKNDSDIRTREINYILKKDEIILIPTYKFQDKIE